MWREPELLFVETKLDWIWPAAAAMYDAKHKEFKIFLKSNFHEFFNQSDWFDEKDPEAVFFHLLSFSTKQVDKQKIRNSGLVIRETMRWAGHFSWILA